MSASGSRATRQSATRLALTLLAVFVASQASTFAQTIPPSADPGRLPQRFEPPRQPGVDTRLTVPQIPTAAPPERAREIRFVLRGISVTGSTVYTGDQLQHLYQNLIGREVSLLEIYGVANAITAHYRNDGYVLSQAVVPQQQIRNGIVQIQVVEGRINRVTFRGDVPSYHYMLRYAERLKTPGPLTQRELERYLLLINDFPGMRVSGTLAPSDVPGAADLIVEVTYKRVDLYTTWDNRGSRFLGPYQSEFSGAVNGVIDVGDRVLYRYITTLFQPRELQFHEARYQTPVGDYGTILEVWGNWARTRPGFTLRILDIEGETWSWRVRLKQPIIRSRAMNVWLYGGFEWINAENDVLTATFSDDRLRVFRYGVTYEAVDRFRGVNFIDLQVSHGIDAIGARGNSREFGRPGFTKVTLDAQRNQEIWGPVSAFFQFTGQYAGTQLLAPEEFGLGGRTFGRAFDPSEKTGDHGFAVTGELRYTVDEFKIPQIDVPASVQVYGFGDWGRVYHIESNTRKTFEALASAGVGLRFNIGRHLSGQVEGAVPIYGRVASLGTEGRNWRAFFVLNARY